MSNIAPQHHDGFNGAGGLWFELERKIQDEWVIQEGLELSIFAGSVVGLGIHEVIGPDQDIIVPPMFFKIVVRELEDDTEFPKVLAFLFPHQRVRHGTLDAYLVSIDVIEALTGLDFFNEYSEQVQQVVEDIDTIENWGSFLED